MKEYELIETEDGSVIKATQDERVSWIPLDPANRDYNEYLAFTDWVKAGNKAEEFWNQSEEQAE